MRSFGFFSAVAAIACSVFVAAAPFDAVHARAPVALDVPKVEVRCATCSQDSILVLLTNLKTTIVPTCSQLSALNAESATVDVITPLLISLSGALNDALSLAQALVGVEVSVILATVDGTSTVAISVVAGLLGEIICLVLGALGNVLRFVTADVLGAVFVDVGTLLGSLTVCILGLVGNLLSDLLRALLPLIGSVVSVIGLCGFTGLASALGLPL